MDINCRICLSSEESVMLSVFDRVSDFNMCLSELILDISDVKIDETDPYSKIICNECTNELFIAAKFKEKCKKSEEALLFLNNMSEIENDDLEGILDETEIDDEIIQTDLTALKQEMDVEETNSTYEEVEFLDVEDNSSLGYIVINQTEEEEEENDYETDLEQDEEGIEEDEPDTSYSYELIDGPKNAKQPKFQKEPKFQVVINHNCEVCGAGFTLKSNLLKHMYQVHSLIELFSCETCKFVFDTKKELVQHSITHENEIIDAIAEEPQIETSTDDLINRVEFVDVDKKRSHKCETCDKGFLCKSALTTHMRSHTGEKPFKCIDPGCGKSFTTVGGLDLHQKRHTGLKNFKCEFCDRSFVENSNLRVHRRIHTGEKPHTCLTCNRSFSRVFLLQIHQRTHTGEKPYTCDYCDKSFSQNGDLAAHKRIHTGERPHSCTVCGKGFIKSSGLNQHLRKHYKMPRKTAMEEFFEPEYSSDVESKVMKLE